MKKIENNDAMLDRITLIATLYYKDKLSQQEIAKKLNIKKGDVKIVPDYKKYPTSQGRDLKKTFGDIGLAGHWLKLTLHYAFIYKAKMKPFWWLIPE